MPVEHIIKAEQLQRLTFPTLSEEENEFEDNNLFTRDFNHVKSQLDERNLNLRLHSAKSKELDFLHHYYKSNEKTSTMNRSTLWHAIGLVGVAIGAIALGCNQNPAADAGLLELKGTWETLEKLGDGISKCGQSVFIQKKIGEIDNEIARLQRQMDDHSSKSQEALQSNRTIVETMDRIQQLIHQLMSQIASK